MNITPPLTPVERTLYEARLTRAETAYDALVTGTQVRRTIDQNGESVEYTAANIGRLASYIRALREALNPMLAMRNAPRPIGFTF